MDNSISVEIRQILEADRKGKLPKPENMTNSSSWYITEHAMYSHWYHSGGAIDWILVKKFEW